MSTVNKLLDDAKKQHSQNSFNIQLDRNTDKTYRNSNKKRVKLVL
jgi:hypothetical protein